MPITMFHIEKLFAEAPPAKPVPAPLGTPVSTVRSISIAAGDAAARTGVWECTPGQWVRQIRQAEFCHFLSGRATFTPDEGDKIHFGPGDAAHFPENSTGVWDIIETSRKIFLVYDQKAGT